MKSALILVLSPLFLIGVFGDELKSVSVMKGDSVTLHTGVTEIQKDDEIEWRLNGARIAKLSSDSKGISVLINPDGAFGDRLKLDDKTGDLKITDIKTTDAGEYKLQITSTRGSSEKTFRVTVVASADGDAVMSVSVSVQVRDSVTLHTKIQRDDVIQWRFGPQHSLVAEINRKAGNLSTHDGPDGRFRDRLKPDYWTGSLTIRNIGENHAGVYEVDIRSSGYTIHKTFSVTVSDTDAVKSVSVTEGESVPLNTGLTEIQRDDEILWMFRDTPIAEIIKADGQFHTSDGPDGRFRDRLKLDHQTGSLNITDIRTTDSGLYEVTIRGSKHTVQKRFTVTVSGPGSGVPSGAVAWIVVGVILMAVAGVAAVVIYYRRRISELKRQMLREMGVMEGERATLNPKDTEIRKDDDIQWKFRGALIAERKGENGEITVPDDVHYGIFKDRLELDKDSGSLTITDIRSDMSGRYDLRIIRPGHESLKTCRVSVCAKPDNIETVSVMEGDPLTLSSGVTEIQRDDEILWKFGFKDPPIAQIKGGTTETSPSAAGGRFRDRLELDQTGSLTIKNIRPTDAGLYYLYNNTTGESIKSFMVDVIHPKDIGKTSEETSEACRSNSEETSEACRSNSEEVPLMHVKVSDSRL